MMGLTGGSGGPGRGSGPRRIEGSMRTVEDDGLAEIRQAFTREPGIAPAPESCPPPATLWSALHGELPPAEARQVVDHTAACPACAEDWRLAWELESRTRQAAAGEGAPAGARGARFRSWMQWAVGTAAAASLAASIGVLQWSQYEAKEIAVQISLAKGLTLRGDAHGAIRSQVPSGTALPRSRCLLRWASGLEAAFYDVVVRAQDLTVLAQAKGLKKSEFLVPESRLEALPSGAQISWQVTARYEDDRIAGTSMAFVNRVR